MRAARDVGLARVAHVLSRAAHRASVTHRAAKFVSRAGARQGTDQGLALLPLPESWHEQERTLAREIGR